MKINLRPVIHKIVFFMTVASNFTFASLSNTTTVYEQFSQSFDQQSHTPLTDLKAGFHLVRRYPIHLLAAGCAGILAYKLAIDTEDSPNNSKAKAIRTLSIGLCLFIGLAALTGQDNAMRGVDYLAALNFVWGIVPKLEK